MRSRTGNSLSTLMFMVPLLGVPLMAVFGVPQFVPVIASSVSEESLRPLGTRPRQGVGESVSATSLVSEQTPHGLNSRTEMPIPDLFGSSRRPRRDSRPIQSGDARRSEATVIESSLSTETRLTQDSSRELAAETTQRLNDLFGNSVASATESGPLPKVRATTASLHSATTRSNAARSEQSNEGLTWREAVRRLNELGIQEFRLEPGRQVGEFYFACEFTPHRNARVTRRFEAEATEPLLAVQAVLRQIDEWLPRH